MAWGYEKSFIVEHVEFPKKKLSCKDCRYYEKDDLSCLKRPLYLPEDGYNSWKNCKYFEPTKDAIKKKKIGVEKYIKKPEKVKGIRGSQDTDSNKKVSKSVDLNVHIGDIVEHKADGKGRVVKIKTDRIVVAFNGVEKMFDYPGAFEKGFLRR